MKYIGLCTHLSQTDDWVFNFAFDLVQKVFKQALMFHPAGIRRTGSPIKS